MFAQHPEKRWKEGGVDVRKRRGHQALQQSQALPRWQKCGHTFYLPYKALVSYKIRQTGQFRGKLSSDPPQTEVTNQIEANLSVLTASERALPVLQGHKLFNDF